tara:strand:- start:1035 stop:2120 length:1086 start_codon:yes stop_codon:yes gene_type:complete
MSIFGSLGKLFGYKGASAEAFGGSFAEKASTTFTDRFNKSIDSFEKQVEETDKLLLADELTEAKISKEELSEALKGVKEKVAIGWSPGIAAAIHSAPASTQKIMIDAANSMEDKSTAALDNLWKTSVEINKEMPTLSVMDAAKLLVGNQIRTEFNYDTIPQTDNMLTRLGFKANLQDSIKKRVESRPNMRPDLTVDTDAIIPTGGPSADALAKSKALNKTATQPRLKTYADETLKLLPIINQGNRIGATPAQVIASMEASIALNGIQSTQVDTSGNYIGDAMIKSRKRQRYSDKLKSLANPEGVVIFSNVGFIDGIKQLAEIADAGGEGSENATKQLENIISKIREIYGSDATSVFGKLIK